jgi:predicted metal-dependent hydrolase
LLRYRPDRVLRIMRQFMKHSNNTAIALQAHPDAASAKVAALTLPFGYEVVRSKRRTMVVHVRHQQVQVRAPKFVSDKDIREFVVAHQQWILSKLEQKASQDAQRLDLRDGGCIFYKGRSLRVRIVQSSQESIITTDSEFRIATRIANEAGAAKALQRWLIAQAKTVLPARTRALAAHFKVDSRLKEVVFRKTKTKWGHCTSSGRIQFNWLIMLAPDAIIDYMICHEVSHLLVMNHSAKFWSLVETVCPDYRSYVKWLRKHEHRLWL